ncbi:hypothetical protein BD770DRAFT_386107 [Pilaira anomala]|nr:hypothetical protein BD770DRAFT_399297 [Pilaira anomala]KAI9359467.1 hypothetical protein BD770DRAFT_386107 [Pilaira anomala]
MIKLMRPAFQHGIGPHRMSKILRIMHTERYDELQLQYYIALDNRRANPNLLSFFSNSSM